MVISFRRLVNTRHANRAGRAIKLLRKMVARHTGAEKVIITNELVMLITRKGMEKPPNKVTVVVSKIAEKIYIVKPAVKVRT
ncbi:50S ribosomal protein L31e [Sulfolobales archaeon HS-7]|nr:50S ribosomal protein L31e [Sulfolobales archaeon HS-7]